MDPFSVLQQCASKVPNDLHPRLNEFKQLYEQRLWHQLTERMRDYFLLVEARPSFPTLFTGLIATWYKKMNQLVWIKLAIITAEQMSPSDALALLDNVVSQVKADTNEKETEGSALLCLATMAAATFRLKLGDVNGTKEAMEEWADRAEGFASVDPVIPATFFRVSADYYKTIPAYADYYRNALLYLSCMKVDGEGLSPTEAQQRAHDLCIAALLGDTIYNFGELLAHPILEALTGTPNSFLKQVLLAFNAGDQGALERYQPALQKHPALVKQGDYLAQKMCLMALVEMAFCYLKSGRTIVFADISKATRVPLDQVEFLLIKALALKLIKGKIREPEGIFEIEWVQPRVLDLTQVRELRQGIAHWRDKVQAISGLVHMLLPDSFQKIVPMES